MYFQGNYVLIYTLIRDIIFIEAINMSKKERLEKLFKEIEALKEDELHEVENAVRACKVVQTLRNTDIKTT